MEELAVVTCIERWENDRMRAAVVKENIAGLFFSFRRNHASGGVE
jgi:hypothetical protein